MAKSKRVKIADLKAGVTLWHVHAFPHRGKQGKGSASISCYHLIGRPKKGTSGLRPGNLFVPYTEFNFYEGKRQDRKFSVMDSGVIPNGYNFHRMFHTQKMAERYAQRMRDNCLTPEERERAKEFAARDRRNRDVIGIRI